MESRNKLMFDLDIAVLQSYNPWPHSPTAKAKKLIKPNSRVLDIGCTSGYMAEQLRSKGCTVMGIEKDHNAALAARDYCQKVIEADVERLERLPFPDGFFEVILCLDILEHLARPDTLLFKLKRYLAPDGRLIAPIPNIARLEHRLRLLMGRLDYNNQGLGALSIAYLRFFTKKTAINLFQNAGYNPGPPYLREAGRGEGVREGIQTDYSRCKRIKWLETSPYKSAQNCVHPCPPSGYRPPAIGKRAYFAGRNPEPYGSGRSEAYLVNRGMQCLF